MSKKPAKKKLSGKIIGVDVDNKGDPLYPGKQVLYWTGDGRTEVKPWPAFLSQQMVDGNWSVVYLQRHMLTPSFTVKYSEKPAIHTWTFIDAFWLSR